MQGEGPACPICEEGISPPLHSTHLEGAPREHGFAMLGTRVTFLRKESHQRFARNLLVLDFEEVLTSGTRGWTPLGFPRLLP